jgi:beta-fructofuranosidase
MMSWELQPPLFNGPSGFGQMEVFQVEEVDGQPVLIWCVGRKAETTTQKKQSPQLC